MNQMEGNRKRFALLSNLILSVGLLVFTVMTGEHGAGYLAGAFECFFLLLLLTAYTMPEAIAKLIRIRMQKGQSRNASQILKAAVGLGVVYSVVGSLFLLFGADFLLGSLMGVSYGAFTVRLLVPGYVLFVFSQVLRGYFQGMGSAVPTGISQILQRIIWILTGILFCFLFRNYGKKVSALLVNEEFEFSFAGAGVAAGFDLAMLFVLLFLLFLYQTNKRNVKASVKEPQRMAEGFSQAVYMLFMTMLPVMLYQVLGRVQVLGGMAILSGQMENSVGICGVFYGKYMAVIALCVMVLRLPLIPLQGIILNALKKEELKLGKERFSWGVHYILVNGVFLAVMLAVLGDTFWKAVGKDSGQAGNLFVSGSTLVVFATLSLFFAEILIGLGQMKKVLLSSCAGTVIFFLCAILGTKGLSAGAGGIAAALCLSSLVTAGSNGFLCMRMIHWKPEWIYRVVLPISTAALSGVIMLLLNKALVTLVGGLLSSFICLAAGAFANWLLLLSLRGIKKGELMIYPGGKILVKFAEAIRLL